MQRAEAVREEPKSPQTATTLPFPSPLIYTHPHFKNLANVQERKNENEKATENFAIMPPPIS